MTDNNTQIVLTKQELRRIAENAGKKGAEEGARRAIEGLFLQVGIDIKDPTQLRELKENLGFLQRASYAARLVKATTIKTCVGAIVTGALALLILGFKDWIAEHVGIFQASDVGPR